MDIGSNQRVNVPAIRFSGSWALWLARSISFIAPREPVFPICRSNHIRTSCTQSSSHAAVESACALVSRDQRIPHCADWQIAASAEQFFSAFASSVSVFVPERNTASRALTAHCTTCKR